MKLFLTKFTTILILLFINESSSSAIRNLRSHYDAGTDTILVDWEWDELSGGLGRQQLEGSREGVLILNSGIFLIKF